MHCPPTPVNKPCLTRDTWPFATNYNQQHRAPLDETLVSRSSTPAAIPVVLSYSRGVSPLFGQQPATFVDTTAALGKRLRGFVKFPAMALGNSKLSHSTSSLASHLRSGSDGYSTKLSENLNQIFHPHSGQQPLQNQHHQQTSKANKSTRPPATTLQFKSQISDPTTGLGHLLRPKPLSKSATTSSITFPSATQSPERTRSLKFEFSSHLSIGQYKDFLKQPHQSHNLKNTWPSDRYCKGNQPKFYQTLLSGKFPMSPRFAIGRSRQKNLNAFIKYRRLKRVTKRQEMINISLPRKSKLFVKKKDFKTSGQINKSYPPNMSRQNSNEECRGSLSIGQSLENIFYPPKRGNTVSLQPAQRTAFFPPPFKAKRPNTILSMFGGSCGNIYEKTKRRGSGFDHPLSLYSAAYHNTIIGLESLEPKQGMAGFKSPKFSHGIGDFKALKPIRCDKGFSDVGYEGTEEEVDSEEGCTMDFDTESMSSQSSAGVAGVNEYRYRTSRLLTQNPLYITNSSSCSSLETGKQHNRNRRTKKGSRKNLPMLRPAQSTSRRSSGTDMELLLNQKQKQGKFKNFGRVVNMPPKWSSSHGTLTEVQEGNQRMGNKNKSRRKDKHVNQALNEELIFFKNQYRKNYGRVRSESDDKFATAARSKATSTVPHSRTESPCSVNSLYLTTRSNTPTQFQMHFHPIHPVAGGRKSREPLQKVSPFGVNAVVRGGGPRTIGGVPSVGGVGSIVVATSVPEQKLSVRTKHMKLSQNYLLVPKATQNK